MNNSRFNNQHVGFLSGTSRFPNQTKAAPGFGEFSTWKETKVPRVNNEKVAFGRNVNLNNHKVLNKSVKCSKNVCFGNVLIKRTEGVHSCIEFYNKALDKLVFCVDTTIKNHPVLLLPELQDNSRSSETFIDMVNYLKPYNYPYKISITSQLKQLKRHVEDVYRNTRHLDKTLNVLFDEVRLENFKNSELNFEPLKKEIEKINQTEEMLTFVLKSPLQGGGTILHKIVTLLFKSYELNSSFWEKEKGIIKHILDKVLPENKHEILQTTDSQGYSLQAKCDSRLSIPI